MLLFLFNMYLYMIGTVFICGLTLILCDKDWRLFEEMYLNVVIWVQNHLIKLHGNQQQHNTSYEQNSTLDLFGSGNDDVQQTTSKKYDTDNVFETSSDTGSHTDDGFELLQLSAQPSPNLAVLELSSELCGQAIETIVKDDVGEGFRLSRDYCRYELKGLWRLYMSKHCNLRRLFRRVFRRHRHHYHKSSSSSSSHRHHHARHYHGQSSTERRMLRLLLVCSLAFRFGALFPVRLAFLLASFAYLFVCCAWHLLKPLSPLLKTRCAVIYCRLYSTGCGFITRYQGTEHRPKKPGVICANHLSPNDVQVIFGDIPADRDSLYMVTGQKHRGIIWVLENLVDKVCPAIWLERGDTESRRQFSVQVLEAAKNAGPVILFPEGYCSNNSLVLMFRRAVFQDNVTVYPVAIRQEARFGDAYWSEDNFMHYLFRAMTSWAIVYNVHYLAPQQRRSNENATEFAARVQRLIATRVGVRTIAYDGGGLWYKPAVRHKAHAEWQKRCAVTLVERLNAANMTTTTTDSELIGEEEEEPAKSGRMNVDDKKSMPTPGGELSKHSAPPTRSATASANSLDVRQQQHQQHASAMVVDQWRAEEIVVVKLGVDGGGDQQQQQQQQQEPQPQQELLIIRSSDAVVVGTDGGEDADDGWNEDSDEMDLIGVMFGVYIKSHSLFGLKRLRIEPPTRKCRQC
uniref:Phospholipid/glycerol acyltransferase domain-containing protein n=1 Tax=Globodera rostochiensis TaxID=31243 RepID=A0A914H8F4_GLORO